MLPPIVVLSWVSPVVLCGVFDRGLIGAGGVVELGRGCLCCVVWVASVCCVRSVVAAVTDREDI